MDFPPVLERSATLGVGVARGTIAAMAMTGLRQVTTGLGVVEQTPPDVLFKRGASRALARRPRLVPFLAKRDQAITEVAHWAYGAAGGAVFALLPGSIARPPWGGPAYGLATWLLLEASVAPVLGLEQARRGRVKERLAFAAGHLLYGAILAGGRRWALPGTRAVRPGE